MQMDDAEIELMVKMKLYNEKMKALQERIGHGVADMLDEEEKTVSPHEFLYALGHVWVGAVRAHAEDMKEAGDPVDFMRLFRGIMVLLLDKEMLKDTLDER